MKVAIVDVREERCRELECHTDAISVICRVKLLIDAGCFDVAANLSEFVFQQNGNVVPLCEMCSLHVSLCTPFLVCKLHIFQMYNGD